MGKTLIRVDTSGAVGLFLKPPRLDMITPRVACGASGRGAVSDHVQISDLAQSQSLERLERLRAERVDLVRQQIAAGTYETDERVSAAAAALARALSP